MQSIAQIFRVYGILAWLVTTFLLALANGSAAEERTLRVGVPLLLQPPDPVIGGFNAVNTGLAETLFKLGRDLQPEPWLATGARRLDGHSWEITLQQGVQFHNGTLMDAAAVKASLERAVAKSPTVKVLLDIARLEVKAPFTLTITTLECQHATDVVR